MTKTDGQWLAVMTKQIQLVKLGHKYGFVQASTGRGDQKPTGTRGTTSHGGLSERNVWYY
jgi:hypothetical protein